MADKKRRHGVCREVFTAECAKGKHGKDIMRGMEPDHNAPRGAHKAHTEAVPAHCKTETVFTAPCFPKGFAPSALD